MTRRNSDLAYTGLSRADCMLQNAVATAVVPWGYAARYVRIAILARCGARGAQLNLRKTVDGGHGVYRIFEVAATVFLVLDEEGRTVDEFKVVDHGSAEGTSVKRALRHGRRRLGAPDLARGFIADLNAARKRH